MKIRDFVAGGVLVLVSITLALVIAVWALDRQSPPPVVVEQQGVTRFGALHLTEAGGTATPVLRANQTGTGKIVEFLDGGTAVWSLLDGGEVSGGAGQSSTNLVVAGPTAIGTATPAALIDNAGVSNLLEVRDGATPVFTINNGGNWTATGGGTQNNWSIVSAPTAIATATPAMVVDSLGVSNIFEARAAATPMVSISSGGDITLENGEQLNNSTDGFVGFVGGQLWSTTTTTATDGLTITPTVYSVYNLDTSAEVTITLAACTEGGPLVIVGDDANNININDTNIRSEDGGASVIGQYDIQLWFCIDQEWLLVAESTDS